MIKLGIDLDNTIICYDKLIYNLARKKFSKLNLKNKKISKKNIKNEIIKNYGNGQWTKLQGIIYGKEIINSILFDGFYEIIKELRDDFELFIISHKTKYPAIGKKVNLRDSAKSFLKKNKISFCKNELIKNKNIHFANTKKQKIEIIKNNKIDIFIDDLDEILELLPKDILKIHFSKKKAIYKNFSNWKRIKIYLNKQKKKLLEKKISKITRYKIKIIKKINYESNNEIYLINLKKKDYLLKVYKNNKEKFSFSKELLFLKESKSLNKTPKVKFYDLKSNFIIMEFIKGIKIKKITLNDITQIVNFIKTIQKIKKKYDLISNSKIKYATDKIFSISDILKNIEQRIKISDKRININNLKLKQAHHIIKKAYKRIKLELMNSKINLNKKKNYCLSPSDLNVRNIIKQKNKYFFIDFEYSGLDNCFKLVLDFLSQPDINFNKHQLDFTIKSFNKIFENLKEDFNPNLLILNNIKWFYIILNFNYKNKFLNKQINKSLKYFDEKFSDE